jgi:hypothetical protein
MDGDENAVRNLVYTYMLGKGSISEVFLGYNAADPTEIFVVKKIARENTVEEMNEAQRGTVLSKK